MAGRKVKPFNKRCNDSECPLIESAEVPYSGDTKARIVFCGESPGYQEELDGQPFVGESGDMAKSCAREAKLNWRSLFVVNSARCRIRKEQLSTKEIAGALAHCRPHVVRAIKAIKPKAIICAGDFAARQILKKSGITNLRGRWVKSAEFGCWVLPTFHPAYILRNRALRPLLVDDLKSVAEFVRNGYKPLTMADSDTDYGEADSIRFLLDAAKKGVIRVSLDTEDQGLEWMAPNFVCISASFGYGVGKARNVVFYGETTKGKEDFTIQWPRMVEGSRKAELTEVFVRKANKFDAKVKELAEFLESERIYKITMHGNFDRHALTALFQREGLPIPKFNKFVLDIQSCAHVIEENIYKMADLTKLQRAFTPIKEDYNQEFELKYGKSDMLAVPREAVTRYACMDADVTYQAGVRIREILVVPENERLLNYVVKFVQPTLQALANMEERGSYVDRDAMPKIKEEVYGMMMDAQKAALKAVPTAIKEAHAEKNDKKKDGIYLTRRDYVRDIVFDPGGFRFKATKLTKGSKEPSVDKHVLSELLEGRLTAKARVFIEKYRDFSEYHTLWSRYLNGFEKHIKDDGRIHSQLSLAIAVTGRVSSSKPNMMNNPKRSKSAKKIRRLIAAPKGWLLLEVDQSQAELRWAAHVSRDRSMIRLFQEDKIDIHTATAMDLKGVKSWAEWKKLDEQLRWTARRDAKCFHPDTEVLTENGWKKMMALAPGEQIYQAVPESQGIRLELTTPLLRFDPNHTGYLVKLKNEGIDLDVTPDHRMLGQRYNGKFFDTTPEEFNKARYFWNSGYKDGTGRMVDHSLLKLAVAVQADGSYVGNQIRFGFTKERKCQRLEKLLEGKSYQCGTWKNGTKWYSLPENLSDEIKKLLDPDKTLPWWWLSLEGPGRVVVLDEARYWDATKQENWKAYRYSSTKKQNVDVLQALASITERKTRLTVDEEVRKDSHSPVYNLTVRANSKSRGENILAEKYAHHGEVAVLSVPSTYVLVRSGGVPVITGQSVNFGLLFGMTVNGFIRYAKEEYGIVLDFNQAQAWVDIFFGKYPGLLQYHRDIVEFCRTNGYVESPLGRRRRLPEIHATDKFLRLEAERQAINSPIQSPSSDTVLIALGEMERKEVFHPDYCMPSLFIHDSLIFEVKDCSKAVDYAKMIIHEMEHPPLERDFGVKLLVPLKAEAEIGPNAAEMEELKIGA